jgi:hypothetical protein
MEEGKSESESGKWGEAEEREGDGAAVERIGSPSLSLSHYPQ